MSGFIQLLVSGLATGAIYALVAVGFALLWQTSQTINFAQGEFVMVPAFFALAAMKFLGLGFFPALTIREVLLRQTPLRRGGWLTFLILSVVLAIAAFWELLEWWVTLLVASDVGQAFLGSQGDIWDAQWDMVLALIGAMVALPLLGRLHDRSMARVPGLVEGARR